MTSRETASLAKGLGLALMVCGPLVPNHYPPWSAFYSEATTVAGLGLLCAAWLAAGRRDNRSALALVPLAVSIVPLLQAGFGLVLFWGDAWVASAYLLLFALSIFCGGHLAEEDRAETSLRVLFAGLALSALLSALVELEQWLRLGQLGIYAVDLRPGGQPFGNLGQPNHLATWLMLGLIGLHFLFESRILGRTTLAAGAVLLTVGVAMTRSRTGLLEMAAFVLWLLFMRGRVAWRSTRGAALATAGLLAVLVVAWPAITETLILDQGRTTEQQAQGGTRLLHWGSMVDAIGRQPLFGYGWNQVSVAQAAVATRHAASAELIEHSHNVVFDLLVWNGTPIGLLMIGAFSWWAYRQWKACGDTRVALLLAAIGVVLIHGLLEYPLEYAYFLLPVGLMMGIVEGLSPVCREISVPRALAFLLVAGTFALCAWIALDYEKVEENNRERRFEAAQIGPPRAPLGAPDVVVLTQQRELLRFARAQAIRGMPGEQLRWMRNVALRFGYPPVLLRYAVAAGLNGEPAEAADALARLCKTHPAARCNEGLAAWATMVAGPYPELKRVELPHPEK